MFGRIPTWIAGLALIGLATAPVGGAGAKSNDTCFRSNDWHGWSASGDGDVLYLRVGLHDIYRVDLNRGAHVRHYGDFVLINEVRGSPWICSHIDLDLTLANRTGYRQPLIARSLRKLTPEEVAAIPRKDLPW